nr:hypothetical protein BaRGS_011858 [Batillaria attramentaria]
MGKDITILDTPGLYDASKSPEEICADIVRSVAYMHLGGDKLEREQRFSDLLKGAPEELMKILKECDS